ncbi:MAG: hypothetical protein M1830_007087, partial [Pleopsidium flavum]
MHYRLLALFALLTPTLAYERVLSWTHHLDARHNQEAFVPDGAIADAAMRTPAWLQTLQKCIDEFGKDPFLHNWQGNTCHGWGFFKGGEPAGLIKNPADCYQFGQGWMQFYATQGVTD